MQSANECYGQVRDLYQNGSFEQALTLLGTALAQHPDHAGLWYFRGLSHHARGEFIAAVAALETLTTLAPLVPGAQLALASSYLAIGKRELARTVYLHLATLVDIPRHLLAQLAAGLDCLHELPLALKIRREWARAAPDCAAASYSVARTMAQLQYPAMAALPFLRNAFQLVPDRLLYRVDLALTLQRCGDLTEAHELLSALTPEELATLGCPPRLHALEALFAATGDLERQSMCRVQRMDLASRRKHG